MPAPDPDVRAGEGEVIVSTGGGAVAAPLVEAALGARALSPLDAATWRLLVGPNTPETEFQDLAARAPAGFVVERARPDFRALLARARLSISQAGYNTVLEVLAAGIPAVVAPFAAGSETEQSLRAGLLAERGMLTVVDEAALGPETLAAAVRAALAWDAAAREPTARGPRLAGLDTSGADKTAQIVRERLAIVVPR
jgi:predicted glycosyltransferase